LGFTVIRELIVNSKHFNFIRKNLPLRKQINPVQNHLLFLNLGGGEIFVIMLFVLLFFGSKGIPQVARGLGKGMREFKDAMNGIEREIQQEANKVKDEVKKIEEDTNA